jgi:gluconolactonase
MKAFGVSLVALGLMLAAGTASAQEHVKSVTRLDPALDALVSADAKVEQVATGFGFTEGVTWLGKGKSGFLVFSDMPANVLYKLAPDGKTSIYLQKSGYQGVDVWRVGMPFTNGKPESDPKFEKFNMVGANGVTADREGRLVLATGAGRSIDRIEKSGRRTVLADRYEGKRFGGTNDVVVRKKDGSVYFTDTFGGLLKLDKDPRKELPETGLYMIRGGKVTRIIDDIAFPNGLGFSPDEKTFYANGGRERFIRSYEVNADGTLGDSAVFADFSAERMPGITDGMKVDSKGNVWTSGPGGVWVLAPDGKRLGRIAVPQLVANPAHGDADHKTLYLAART